MCTTACMLHIRSITYLTWWLLLPSISLSSSWISFYRNPSCLDHSISSSTPFYTTSSLPYHAIPCHTMPCHAMPPKWHVSTCTYVCCFQVKDEASAMKGYFGFELLHQDLCTGEHHRYDPVTPAIYLLQFFDVPHNSFWEPIIITYHFYSRSTPHCQSHIYFYLLGLQCNLWLSR